MAENLNTDYIKIAAFILAIVSLFWNILNSFYARSISQRNRSLNILLDEFRSSIVTPIRDALNATDQVGAEIRAVARSNCKKKVLRQTTISLNQEIIEKLNKLYDSLEDANKSIFADGEDWLELIESRQDIILQLLDAANNPIYELNDVRSKLLLCHSEIRSLKTAINDHIGDQIIKLST